MHTLFQELKAGIQCYRQNAYVCRGLCLHSPLKTWQQKEDDPVSADLRCFHL